MPQLLGTRQRALPSCLSLPCPARSLTRQDSLSLDSVERTHHLKHGSWFQQWQPISMSSQRGWMQPFFKSSSCPFISHSVPTVYHKQTLLLWNHRCYWRRHQGSHLQVAEGKTLKRRSLWKGGSKRPAVGRGQETGVTEELTDNERGPGGRPGIPKPKKQRQADLYIWRQQPASQVLGQPRLYSETLSQHPLKNTPHHH